MTENGLQLWGIAPGRWPWVMLASWRGLEIVGVSLWIGLGILTLVLVALVRSPWGRDKPLARCIALSLLAHALLVVLAYATRFVQPPAPPSPVIQVSMVEPSGAVEDADDGITKRPHEGLKPWESSTAGAEAPEVLPPAPEPIADGPADGAPGDPSAEDDATSESVVSLPLTEERAEPPEPPEPPDEPPAEPPLPASAARRTAAAPESAVVAPAAADIGPEVTWASLDRDRPTGKDASEAMAGEWTDLPAPPARALSIAAPVAGRSETPFPEATVPADLVPVPEVAPSALPAPSAVPARAPEVSPLADVRPLAADEARRRLAALPPLVRPGDARPLPRLYRLRLDAERKRWFLQLGGTLESLEAIERGIAWLVKVQAPDGRWDASRFGGGEERRVLGHDRGGAGARADTGMTGLAVLALLGIGHTHLDGPHQDAVRRGLAFLKHAQRSDGCLAGDAKLYAAMYCHSMAALALAEAYAMTGDPSLHEPVRRAVAYSLRAQSWQGGWRYQPGDAGDMSQFGWQVMMLSSARQGGIVVSRTERDRMRRFLARCTGPDGVSAGYRPGHPPTAPMTAEAMVTRVFLEALPPESALPAFRRRLKAELPGTRDVNLYYWYYATLALHQLQDELWPVWSRALQRELVRLQCHDADRAGSWEPKTVWGSYGGRVYATALATLTLEVYVRYLPLYAWRR